MNEETVLFVDDEANLLNALRRELRGEPYEIVTAPSGPAGLDCMAALDAAVVVSDHQMPGMSGVEFLSQVRDRWPDTYRVMMTAFGDIETISSAVNLGGIHRFLTKPWNPDDLRLTIQEGLERHRLIHENRDLTKRLEAQNVELKNLNQTLEQRVAERTGQLEKAYGELVQTEKLSAVGRLAAGVVHEVLNPLTIVTGRVDMMLMDAALDASHLKSLEITREQIEMAVGIMNNLRDFSKQRPPQRTQVDVNALAAHTLELVVHETNRRAIEVSKQLEEAPPIQADHDQLSQVLLNLANNAIDAMSEGGRLRVETHRVGDGGSEGVELLIADTGPGIPAEDLERVFEPFYTTKETGTGLGLSICKGIVEVHGGSIEARSEVGEGTTFAIRLPTDPDAARGPT
jgi:hypothetical protein